MQGVQPKAKAMPIRKEREKARSGLGARAGREKAELSVEEGYFGDAEEMKPHDNDDDAGEDGKKFMVVTEDAADSRGTRS